MNPQFDQTPGLHLPQPSAGAPQPGYNPASFAGAPQPTPSAPGSVMPAAPFSQSVPPAGMAAAPQPQVMPQQPLYAQPTQPAAPAPPESMAIDDGEGIVDDEWVNKARDIAMRYKGDPFMQSRELSKLKAQYVKARYNKDLKVSEER